MALTCVKTRGMVFGATFLELFGQLTSVSLIVPPSMEGYGLEKDIWVPEADL